jgi:hypothetical protein
MDDQVTPRRRVWTRLRLGHVAAVAVLFGACGGVAYAASGGSFVGPHGNLNTCVPIGGGTVRMWRVGHKCSPGRVLVTWAATGATGATGQTGATGATNPAATTVDGQAVDKLRLELPTPASGTTSVSLYTGNGLSVLADCTSAGVSSLVANGPATADSEFTVSGEQGNSTFGSQTNALGPASNAVLGPAGAGEASFSYSSSAGAVVSGDVGYQSAPSFGNYAGCGFFGSITVG